MSRGLLEKRWNIEGSVGQKRREKNKDRTMKKKNKDDGSR